MKHCIAIFLAVLCLNSTQAQLVKNTKSTTKANWQNLSLEDDGVYGAEVDKAYSLLKNEKPKKKVVVALIGSGVDIEHPDLAGAIWKNPKEKQNNKDDNKNGLVDDIYGWNFLGNSKGEIVETITKQGDRDFIRLKDKDSYMLRFDNGKKYYAYNELTNTLTEVSAPKNVEEYAYFKKLYQESKMASHTTTDNLKKVNKLLFRDIYADFIKQAAVEDRSYAASYFKEYVNNNMELDSLQNFAYNAIYMNAEYLARRFKDEGWTFDRAVNWLLDSSDNRYAQMYTAEYNIFKQQDARGIIGDDPYNINDKVYGNGTVKTRDSRLGTMCAGVIAATRNNGIGIDGITNNVELMTLRVEADDNGEVFLKDVALAIRYAVDNGANIIQMPKTNTLFPADEAKWVADAMLYAESKGVLTVLAHDQAYNLTKNAKYPNKYIVPGHELNNLIVVSASDEKGNPFNDAAFGKGYVDIFAPGVNINTTYLGGTYRTETSSRLAASMVVGVAALIKSYYPKLTAVQLKEIILNNVTSRADDEVEKDYYLFEYGAIRDIKRDIFAFSDLCTSGGILNASKAVQAAKELAK